MNNARFLQYRMNAFHYFVGEQFKQLQQLGAMVALFMYIAIPALFMFLFMGLGKILVQEPGYASVLVVAILVAQCELSAALSNGVLDANNRLFQRTLVPAAARVLSDVLLSLASNVALVLSAVLLFSVDVAKWGQALHFMAFMVALFLGVQLAIYKAPRVKAYVITLLLFYVSGLVENLWALLSVAIGAAVLLLALPEVKSWQKWRLIRLPFWGRYHWFQQDELWWRGLLLLGVYLGAVILHQYRPDLAFTMHLVTLPVMLYVATSLQLNQNELMQAHGLWFASLGRPNSLMLGQFIAPLGLVLLGLVAIQSIHFNFVTSVGFFSAGLAMMFSAYQLPRFYALSWVLISVITGLMCSALSGAMSL